MEEAVTEAEKIGYPVILKSTAGGGGIGMRICNSTEELRQAYDAVCHLVAANFNDAGVFLEKYVTRSRHVEVQIFGNEYGETTALAERDCSVQRRNQKVVEESPAPNLSDEVREKIMRQQNGLQRKLPTEVPERLNFLYDDQTEGFLFP